MDKEKMSSLDDAHLQPKYRQYVSAIDKVLKSFESSSEWADLISALGKLNKVLNSKFKLVPKHITIGKRLAQCMHPALPGGVHLKALEVYNSIFNILDSEKLKADLHLYTIGIFPLFVNASMQVKPKMLQLYETHFLPLEDNLACCIDGMLLSLLPGMEEGTEHFDQTDLLLEKICLRVGEQEFYGALWRCVLSSSTVRLPAVQLILRRFDRKKTTDDQLFIIGTDVEIMVKALCESLRDLVVLTQRSSLDVLVLFCPLSDIPVSKNDVCTLLYSALHCLLRRDMSLNRRLYSWLLGSDPSNSREKFQEKDRESYFDSFSKHLLTKAFQQIIINQMEKINDFSLLLKIHITEELYPLRLLINLLDKAEIGAAIIDDLLVDIFRLLKTAVDFVAKKQFTLRQQYNESERHKMKSAEMLQIAKSSNLLLNTFEPSFLWQFLCELVKSSVSENPTARDSISADATFSEVCEFVCLLLDLTNFESHQETPLLHVPNLLFEIITALTGSIEKLNSDDLSLGLKTCKKLLDLSLPTEVSQEQREDKMDSKISRDASASNHHNIIECCHIFYHFFTIFVQLFFTTDKKEIDSSVNLLEMNEIDFDDLQSQSSYKEHGDSLALHDRPTTGDIISSSATTIHNMYLINVFEAICKLLLDFASVPVLCNGSKFNVLQNEGNESTSGDVAGFPLWLRCLLWSICGNSLNPVSACFRILSGSLSSLLELISLAESLNVAEDDTETTKGLQINSVHVISPLTSSHINVLYKKTVFFQVVTKRIWMIFDDSSLSMHHLNAVQLITQLHAACPDNRCENILLQDMISSKRDLRINALLKFCNLWHFTRILYLQGNFQATRPLKEFKRCLFAVFDLLSFSTNSTHKPHQPFERDDDGNAIVMSIAAAWLQHCLEEGDLIRVLRPLLLVALHPRTHSISVHSPKNAENHVSEPGTSSTTKPLTESLPAAIKTKTKYDDIFIKMIANDIDEGKRSYSNLVASLTSLTPQNVDPNLGDFHRKAGDIVLDIIDSSLTFLKENKFNAVNKKDKNRRKSVDLFETFNETEDNLFDQNLYSNLDFSFNISTNSKHSIAEHMLIYQERIDVAQCLYAIRSLYSFLDCHPTFFVYSCVTTPLSSEGTKSNMLLLELLDRHVRAMAGDFFYGEQLPRSPNVMVFDALLVICLRSIQSWHFEYNSEGFQDLRCMSISVLASLLSQVSRLLDESTLNFSNLSLSNSSSPKNVTFQQLAPFVRSVLLRYDATRIILSCLKSTVEALQALENNSNASSRSDFSIPSLADRNQIMSLNCSVLSFWWCGNHVTRVKSFQLYLIKLIREVILLEHRLNSTKPSKPQVASDSDETCTQSFNELQLVLTRSALKVLRLQHSSDVHAAWLDLIIFSLPYMTKPLSEVVLSLTPQLCRNLDHATAFYTSFDNYSLLNNIPVDYVITLLRSLQSLTHFSLFSHTPPSINTSLFHKSTNSSSVPTTGSPNNNSAPFSALGSIFNVLTGNNNSSSKTSRSMEEQVLPPNWLDAKKSFLRNLPKIISCLALVLSRSSSLTSDTANTQSRKLSFKISPTVIAGDSETIKQGVLQILNPLSLQYGESLICALAIAWGRKGRTGNRQFDVIPNRDLLTDQQGQLLDLICSVRSLRCDVTLNLVKSVINQPPELPSVITSKKRKITYEERLLHFVLLFIQEQTSSSLEDAWPSLSVLLRDCLALTPTTSVSATSIAVNSTSTSIKVGTITSQSYFFLLLIVSEFVKRVSPFDDKKQQKDLQDICVKCIEGCSTIVDRSLEHGSWLGRRLPSVLVNLETTSSTNSTKQENETRKANQVYAVPESSNNNLISTDSTISMRQQDQPTVSEQSTTGTNIHYQNSVQALNIMSQVLANLLDVVYGSEEKEKTVPVLSSVMVNVIPFLRTHSFKNAASFRAATSLLSSVSGYQHTRKSWKKEAYDLFLSPEFFRLPFESVLDWGNIIEHLMTHDVTTFKDFMARLSIARTSTAGTSLNIFSNREMELEQRAMLLKRLAFIILSSATSQYQKFLPEIQERLSESLKFHQVPYVQEQVFLCFRVLLLRVSPLQLTSLWPSIITEMVQVLGQIEDELIVTSMSDVLEPDDSSTRSKQGSNLSLPTPNQQQQWLGMFLSACKLLDLALSLQDKRLPHFKMFRWSFVKEGSYNVLPEVLPDKNSLIASSKMKTRSVPFVPHCLRIKMLLDRKNPLSANEYLSVFPMRPLLEMKRLTSLYQLHPFFNTIVSSNLLLKQHQQIDTNKKSSLSGQETIEETFQMEKYLWKDFLDDMR